MLPAGHFHLSVLVYCVYLIMSATSTPSSCPQCSFCDIQLSKADGHSQCIFCLSDKHFVENPLENDCSQWTSTGGMAYKLRRFRRMTYNESGDKLSDKQAKIQY